MVRELSTRWGLALPPGRNPRLRALAPLTEPLRHQYRPLMVYLAFDFMAAVNAAMLCAVGYSCCSHGDTVYFSKGVPPPPLPQQQAAAGGMFGTGGSFAVWGGGASVEAASSAGSSAGCLAGDDVEAVCGSARRGGGGIQRKDSSNDGACVGSAGDDSGSSCGSEDAASGPGPRAPIVVLHGVGMGLLPYILLMVGLAATGGCGSSSSSSKRSTSEGTVVVQKRHGCQLALATARSGRGPQEQAAQN